MTIQEQLYTAKQALIETEANLYRFTERRTAILNQIQALEQAAQNQQNDTADGLKPVEPNPKPEQTAE